MSEGFPLPLISSWELGMVLSKMLTQVTELGQAQVSFNLPIVLVKALSPVSQNYSFCPLQIFGLIQDTLKTTTIWTVYLFIDSLIRFIFPPFLLELKEASALSSWVQRDTDPKPSGKLEDGWRWTSANSPTAYNAATQWPNFMLNDDSWIAFQGNVLMMQPSPHQPCESSAASTFF